MTFLLDAQLSPAIASWINKTYPQHTASSIQSHGLRHGIDTDVFAKAVELEAVLVTKDSDFIQRVEQSDNPPKVLWVRVGNTSNLFMRDVLSRRMDTVVRLFESGETIVELT